MAGVFEEVPTLYRKGPAFFGFFFFPIIQFVFYFVLANMFLATVVYKWKDCRRDAQEDVKSTILSCWQSLSCHKTDGAGSKKDDKQDRQVSLNQEFWRRCSVLNYDLSSVFEDASSAKGTEKPLKRLEAALEDAKASRALVQAGAADAHNLEKIFKKAHMEIASQMCRNVSVAAGDDGAGLGTLLMDQPGATEAPGDEDTGDITIGIVEDEVEPGTAKKIKQDLEDKLKPDEQRANSSSVAQEIWLDALITVLEDVGTLQKVQAFFLPPPMIRPRTQQEWGVFDQKKVKMEQRLDKFLRLLIEGTKTQHYKYLKDSAKTKEKVLKQQSLVFADYLDRLEQRIKELQQEIKVLERKNTEMRSHVAPLL